MGGKLRRVDWARFAVIEPSELLSVPLLTLVTTTVARMVRVSIWDGASAIDDQCDPLFSATTLFLPAAVLGNAPLQFIIDGEQQACYQYGGLGTQVRRTDSLVYGPEAEPLEWSAFTGQSSLIMTLDVFKIDGGGGTYEGNDEIRASLSLIPKSD
jgi:hypothetical protein